MLRKKVPLNGYAPEFGQFCFSFLSFHPVWPILRANGHEKRGFEWSTFSLKLKVFYSKVGGYAPEYVKQIISNPMEKIFNFNLDDVLPIHQNITEEEKSFSDFYISQFGLQTDERVDVPFLILCPFSFQNLITDIIRDYNLYLSDLVDIEEN